VVGWWVVIALMLGVLLVAPARVVDITSNDLAYEKCIVAWVLVSTAIVANTIAAIAMNILRATVWFWLPLS
jgi:hypothetical protein